MTTLRGFGFTAEEAVASLSAALQFHYAVYLQKDDQGRAFILLKNNKPTFAKVKAKNLGFKAVLHF